jgi:hypothetical protein
VKKPQLAAFVALGLVAIGCTSLLGDFEVSGSGPNCTGPNCTPEGCNPGQNKCGEVCIDLQTDTANCGACGRACTAGLACGGGNCQCPDQGAFCDGACFPRTDRTHCGPSCATCAGQQVCDGKCVDPPAPEFAQVPRSATGWTDGAGTPLTVGLKPTGQPGTKYECRSAPAAAFATAPEPAWGNCDGANGEGTSHRPTENATTPEGTYVTAYRYVLGTYTSPEIRTRYYVHKTLNGVATCPRQGVPLDGPHFTNDQYFAAATAFATANAAAFPTTAQFPVLGETRADPIYLGNPWIKIPFVGVDHTFAMNASDGWDDDPWPKAGQNYLLNERSLRHKWVMNPERTMILVARQYIHPKTNDCRQRFEIGNPTELAYGPPGRGARFLDCEAFVLNSKGNGICLNPNPAKPAEPAAAPIDARIAPSSGVALVPTFTTFADNKFVQWTAAPNPPLVVGNFVQIPDAPFGRWYKIESLTSNGFYLTEPFKGGNQSGVKLRTVDKTTSAFVLATGFAKLHQDAHQWATGKKKVPFMTGTQITMPLPSHRTKCETVGCNSTKTWLTYLPP